MRRPDLSLDLDVRTTGALGLTVLVGAAVALGAPAGLQVVLLLVVFTFAFQSRWGWAASLGMAVLAWVLPTFLVGVVGSDGLVAARPLQIAVVGGVTAAAALVWRRAIVRAARPDLPRGAVLASLTGAAAWVLGLGLAAIIPGGSFMSWAAHDDSSLDVWATMGMLRFGGLDITYVTNPRPLEHVVTSSLVPLDAVVDGGGGSLHDILVAHAWNWSLAIVVGCTLAGLLGAGLTRALGAGVTAQSVAAAGASVVMLAGPATGFFVYRGQINANITMMLLLSAIAVAVCVSMGPITTLHVQLLMMALVAILWTPFAAIPGLFVCAVVALARSSVLTRAHLTSLRFVAVMGLTLWTLVVFLGSQFVNLAGGVGGSNEDSARIETHLPAPLSWWVLAAVAAVVTSMAWTLRHAARRAAVALACVVGGVALGGAPLFLARGDFAGALEYYPSRYVQMSEVLMAPLAVAGVVAAVAVGTWTSRVLAATATTTVVAAGVTSQAPEAVKVWTPAPVLLVDGDYYGPDEVMYDRVIEFADAPDLRLPWRLDEPHDSEVRRMLSIDLSDYRETWNTPLRSAVRNRRDDEVDRICEIASAATMPVTIVTRDPGLEEDAAAECEPVYLERVTFEVVPSDDTAA